MTKSEVRAAEGAWQSKAGEGGHVDLHHVGDIEELPNRNQNETFSREMRN